MSILKKPDLSDAQLRAKLAKGMGHNMYGEPAWPNDLLYTFPILKKKVSISTLPFHYFAYQ